MEQIPEAGPSSRCGRDHLTRKSLGSDLGIILDYVLGSVIPRTWLDYLSSWRRSSEFCVNLYALKFNSDVGISLSFACSMIDRE